MTKKEIIKKLEEKDLDCFYEDLYEEQQMFGRYETIEEMIDDVGPVESSKIYD